MINADKLLQTYQVLGKIGSMVEPHLNDIEQQIISCYKSYGKDFRVLYEFENSDYDSMYAMNQHIVETLMESGYQVQSRYRSFNNVVENQSFTITNHAITLVITL